MATRETRSHEKLPPSKAHLHAKSVVKSFEMVYRKIYVIFIYFTLSKTTQTPLDTVASF